MKGSALGASVQAERDRDPGETLEDEIDADEEADHPEAGRRHCARFMRPRTMVMRPSMRCQPQPENPSAAEPTLRARLKPLAPGLTPLAVLDKLAAIQISTSTFRPPMAAH